MNRTMTLAVGLSLLGAVAAHAAPAAKAPYRAAADGTTNIADCAQAAPAFRNECISRSRPVTGAQIYAEAAAGKAKMAKLEALAAAKAAKAQAAAKLAAEKAAAKLKKAVPAAVANVPKGFKVAKDGTTNVADCAKAKPAVRNECISRARPLTGKELAQFIKARQPKAAKAEVAAKPAAKTTAQAAAKPVAAAPVAGKGFTIAKDGTTDVADCAKAKAEFRNECISRARPLTGKQLAAFTQKSAGQQAVVTTNALAPAKAAAAAPTAPAKATAAASAPAKGFPIAADGTTNIADCAKAKADFRNECISRSRPIVYGAAKPRS